MKPRNVIFTLILILLLSCIFLCRKWREPVKKEVLNRNPATLMYSSQALCLMQCQQLEKKDVQQVIRNGVILLNKSERFRRPCPTFAVQGFTANRQSLRITLEQCSKETKVLSCFLVRDERECDCPDDKNKVN